MFVYSIVSVDIVLLLLNVTMSIITYRLFMISISTRFFITQTQITITLMKTISFINRTYQDILDSYLRLKSRYKTVRFFKTLINGYYYGYFEVSMKVKPQAL